MGILLDKIFVISRHHGAPGRKKQSPDVRLVLVGPERPRVLYALALDNVQHFGYRLFRRDDALHLPGHIDVCHVTNRRQLLPLESIPVDFQHSRSHFPGVHTQ